MSKLDLLDKGTLPRGFSYPREFLHVIALGLTNLEPWYVLAGSELETVTARLRGHFPNRGLVPFARRQDNDDIACWEGEATGVVVIHDFASPGWEDRDRFKDFWAWFRHAVEEMIEFESFE